MKTFRVLLQMVAEGTLGNIVAAVLLSADISPFICVPLGASVAIVLGAIRVYGI
jgi:hypothetical protein